MPVFEAPYFNLTLPEESVDASTYSFVLPAAERFHPSVVVKFDKLPQGKSLADYVAEQTQEMQKQLKAFTLIQRKPPVPATPTQQRIDYEWGEGSGRFRQIQIFHLAGPRVYTLTGTLLVKAESDHTALVEKALASFKTK